MTPSPIDPEIEVFVRAAAWAGAHALPRLANPAPPILRLSVGIAAGFIIIVAGCWIFAPNPTIILRQA